MQLLGLLAVLALAAPVLARTGFVKDCFRIACEARIAANMKAIVTDEEKLGSMELDLWNLAHVSELARGQWVRTDEHLHPPNPNDANHLDHYWMKVAVLRANRHLWEDERDRASAEHRPPTFRLGTVAGGAAILTNCAFEEQVYC